MNRAIFKSLLLPLCALSIGACRSGEIESRAQLQVNEPLQLSLLSSSPRGSCQLEDFDPVVERCELVLTEWLLWSPAHQEAVQRQGLELRVSIGEEILVQASLISDRDGQVALEIPVKVMKYFRQEPIPLQFEFVTRDFGALSYSALYHYELPQRIYDWLPAGETPRILPFLLEQRRIQLEDFGSRVTSRERYNDHLRWVTMEVELVLTDQISGELLIPQSFEVTALDLRSNTEMTWELESEDGSILIPIELEHRPYDHEYRQRVDVRIKALGESERPELFLALILNLSESKPLQSAYLLEEVDAQHFWHRRSFQTASTGPQEIKISDLWLQSQERGNEIFFQIQFSAALERVSFEGSNSLPLNLFHSRILLKAIPSGSQEPPPPVEFTFPPDRDRRRFQVSTSLPKQDLAQMNDLRFELRVELVKLLHIAPQHYLVTPDGQVLRRYRQHP